MKTGAGDPGTVAPVQIIIGSEALAAGHVTRYELTADYRRVLPDVYVLKRAPLTLVDHIRSAWLVTPPSHRLRRHGIRSARRPLGRRETPIELNLGHNKAPGGVIVRRDTLLEAEVAAARDAGDVNRGGPPSTWPVEVRSVGAVQRLDALANATHFKSAGVLAIGERHPRLRGLRRLPAVLDLVDAGAQSPKETWLRMTVDRRGISGREHRFRSRGPTAIRATSWIWGGRSSCWRSNTTVNITAPTPSSTGQ